MKTQFFKLLVITLAIGLVSCKKENSFSDYKYSDKPIALTCDDLNSKLYQEALYSFEDDIVSYYKEAKTKYDLEQAYMQFIRSYIYGGLKYEDFVSQHTLNVFEALKNENDLWDANNEKSYLNYKSAAINCISKNIKDNALKTTLNALLSTNSMTPKLFATPIMDNYRVIVDDKHLASYVALDLFYAKLFNVDLSKIKLDKPEK